MTILDQLFTFPIILVNMENEERKTRLNLPSDAEERYDMLEGMAEYPYYDFMGIEDRWVPNEDSLEKARDSSFNACAVKFANVPQLLVPWNKEKFKSRLKKFIEEMIKKKKEEQTELTTTMLLSPSQAKRIGDVLLNRDDEDKDE